MIDDIGRNKHAISKSTRRQVLDDEDSDEVIRGRVVVALHTIDNQLSKHSDRTDWW